MTVHANLGGRNGGEARLVHGVVAVRAIEAEITGVQLVAVSYRLNRHVARVNLLWMSQVKHYAQKGASNNQHSSRRKAQSGIESLWKNGAHPIILFVRSLGPSITLGRKENLSKSERILSKFLSQQ